MILTLELTDVQHTELVTAALEWHFQGSPYLGYRPLIDALLNPQPPEGSSMLGEVKWFALDVLPTNVLPCDGSTYLRADYPDLYSILPVDLVVDADTFKTPNLAEKYAIGSEAQIGTEVGDNAPLLTLDQMVEHEHYYFDFQTSAFILSTANGGFRYGTGTARDLAEVAGTGGIMRPPLIEQEPLDNRPASVRLRPGIVAL